LVSILESNPRNVTKLQIPAVLGGQFHQALFRLPTDDVQAMLRDSFHNQFGSAKQIQAQYPPQRQQEAATLYAGQCMALMRGSMGGSHDGKR